MAVFCPSHARSGGKLPDVCKEEESMSSMHYTSESTLR